VSADGDTAYIKHFGSLYALEDYETTTHTVTISANAHPTPKLSLFGMLSYNSSKAELNEVRMPNATAEVEAGLPEMDLTYEEMHTYSDLDFKYYRVGAGLKYSPAPAWSLTGEVDYASLTDDAPYVYGDETGSIMIVKLGIGTSF
jgi:hypothetical protein